MSATRKGFVATYLWRELAALRGRLLAAVITLGVAVGVLTGVYSAINGLFAHRAELYREANIAGHELRFVPEDIANLPDFGGVPGIGAWEARLLLPGSFEKSADERVSALLIAADPARQTVSRPIPVEGKAPAADDLEGALIDRNFARNHGLAIGDAISLKVGHDRMRLVVRGVAVFPEHLIDGAAPGFFMPAKGSLAVLQVSERLVASRMGFRLVNSVVFAAPAAGQDLAPATVSAIEARAGRKLNVEESIPLSRQFGHLYLTMDLDAFKLFTPAICAILGLSCAIILAFVLRQWLATHRASLGVLLALGYPHAAVRHAWLAPLALLLVAGVAVGAGVGWLMMKGFGAEYANAIGMPLPHLRLDLGVYAAAALAALLLVVAVGLWSLRVLDGVRPIDALRETDALPPSAHGDVRIASPLWRYPLRALLRHRRTVLATAAVIAISLAPAMSFFVALHSFEQTIVDGLARDRWHYTVDFLSPVWDDELPKLAATPGVARMEGFARGMVRVEAGNGVESALVTGLAADSLRRPRLTAGRWLQADERDAVLLERRVVDKLGLVLGQHVQLHGTRAAFHPRLVGIVSGIMPSEAYAPLADVRAWLDLDTQNTGALITAAPGAAHDGTPRLAAAALFDNDWVARVMDKRRVTEEFVKHLQEIAGILHLAAGFSLLVAVLALLVSVVFAFAAREGDFALLQILGFAQRDVATMVRREVLLTGAAGVALAVPLALLLAFALNALLGRAWLAVDTYVRGLDLAMVALPAALLLPLAAMPVVRAVRALVPVEVVRKRRFG